MMLTRLAGFCAIAEESSTCAMRPPARPRLKVPGGGFRNPSAQSGVTESVKMNAADASGAAGDFLPGGKNVPAEWNVFMVFFIRF